MITSIYIQIADIDKFYYISLVVIDIFRKYIVQIVQKKFHREELYTFSLIFNKCKFKKNIQGYINKHIIWIFEGKLHQCEFCHDMPTLKAALAKDIFHQLGRPRAEGDVRVSVCLSV